MLADEGTPVHIAALFRDPGIRDERPVEVVLDLRLGEDRCLKAGENCWVSSFLEALQGLPAGLAVALDNGVRCPTPTAVGLEVYKDAPNTVTFEVNSGFLNFEARMGELQA